MNNEQYDHGLNSKDQQPQFPFKKPRTSEDDQSSMSLHSRNTSHNRGANNIFFKTRICVRFRSGICRNGDKCNFAHGTEDLRQPSANWQENSGGTIEERSLGNWDDDQKIIHRMRICKKFYNGEECSFGERCNFLHEDPAKFRDVSGRFRENSVISIGVVDAPTVRGNVVANQPEVDRYVNSSSGMKPLCWKTKICVKFETTGSCPFGDQCHFAHGQMELHLFRGRTEGGLYGDMSSRPYSLGGKDTAFANPITIEEQQQRKKCLFDLKGLNKINRIYADWIDDSPLVDNVPSNVDN